MDKLQIVAQSPLYNHAPCISHVLRRLAVKIWRRQGCPSATSLFVRFGARTLKRLAAGSNLWTEWDTTTYRYSYSRVQEPRLSPVCSSFSVCWHIASRPGHLKPKNRNRTRTEPNKPNRRSIRFSVSVPKIKLFGFRCRVRFRPLGTRIDSKNRNVGLLGFGSCKFRWTEKPALYLL